MAFVADKIWGSRSVHYSITGLLVVFNSYNLKMLAKKTKRSKSERIYWYTTIIHLLVAHLSKCTSVTNRGILAVIIPSLIAVVNMIISTRFNFADDRKYILVKFVIVLVMNFYKTNLGICMIIFNAVIITIVSLCTSYLINTSSRYFYAEYDCLKRSNSQLFVNFIEIPDPIVFIDVSNYQIIYYNLNSESFFNKENKDKQKVSLIDLIEGEDDKSKFRQLTTELVDNRDNESKETLFSLKTETNNGVKLVKYNTLIWKSSWKDTPVLGVRLKPIRRESMLNGDMGNQSKEFYQNSLLTMEHKLRNLMSTMSGHSRIMQRRIENNNFQNIENDTDKLKEEIDELSKLYVYFNNIINVGNLKSLSKY